MTFVYRSPESSSSGGIFQPNKTLSIVDDFIATSSANGLYDWTLLFTTNNISGNSSNPGILTLDGSLYSGFGSIFLGSNAPLGSFSLLNGSLGCNFVIDLVALSSGSNTYQFYIGLIDAFSAKNITDAPTDGCFFYYDGTTNSGNWTINNSASNVTTTHNTSTAASTGMHNYGISVNATANSVTYTIDNVIVANSPITSNITTIDSLVPCLLMLNGLNTIPVQLFDLFYFQKNLTVAR